MAVKSPGCAINGAAVIVDQQGATVSHMLNTMAREVYLAHVVERDSLQVAVDPAAVIVFLI